MGTDPLDPSVPTEADDPLLFDWLCDHMTGGSEIRKAMHRRDLDAASQPPVINVTVTRPDGIPEQGHYRVDTGSHQVRYYESEAPQLNQTRAIYHVVRDGRVEPGGWGGR